MGVVRHGPVGTPARLTTNGLEKTGGSGTPPLRQKGCGRRGTGWGVGPVGGVVRHGSPKDSEPAHHER